MVDMLLASLENAITLLAEGSDQQFDFSEGWRKRLIKELKVDGWSVGRGGYGWAITKPANYEFSEGQDFLFQSDHELGTRTDAWDTIIDIHLKNIRS